MRRLLPLSILLTSCSAETFLAVHDDPPRVTILRPVDLSTFAAGRPVELCAVVKDEDGPEQLVTSLESSREGALEGVFEDCDGGGNFHALVNLGQSSQVLALSVFDSRGQSGAAAVTVIPEENAPPFCAWGVPAEGRVVPQGAPLTVELSVGDPEGAASTLAWTLRSSKDGTVFDGTPPSNGQIRETISGLSEGLHVLEATVVDPGGLNAKCGTSVTVLACVDLDGDGVTTCDGDCDDADIAARPGAAEVADGKDNDCDGATDEGTVLRDDDGDGFREIDGDCDDADVTVNPDAADAPYDAQDTNCDGVSDFDADRDGYDASNWGGTDCEDADADINPGADEVWYDGIDQDCDGGSDYDQDRDGYDTVAYANGEDCDDTDYARSPSVAERFYDGIDQDCRGDDDYDSDHDGERREANGGTDCDDDDPAVGLTRPERWYDGIDQDCDGDDDFDQDGDGEDADFARGTDCDDLDWTVRAGAAEVWYDGVDQDCSGGSDYDQDGDGQTAEVAGGADCDDTMSDVRVGATDAPYDGVDSDCSGGSDDDADQDGFDALARGGTDCDDQDRSVHVGAVEIWYDGEDQDCSGGSDHDQDGDGYTALAAPDGSADDCNDARSAVHVGAPDAPYDGVDSDCAGDNDFDADGDGQIASAWGGADCDDHAAAIRLGAAEIWYDGIDQNCSGGSDFDRDGDGYTKLGAPDGSADDCDDGPFGYLVHPGAQEIWYDRVDENCSGGSDFDLDGDGYDAATFGGADCDDTASSVSPGAVEQRNGGDDDCDGSCDEGLIGAGDLLITEIHRNPFAVTDDRGEWFEVYNKTAVDIVMCRDWTVLDDNIDNFQVLKNVRVPAGGYAVFGRFSDTSINGGVSVTYPYGGAMDLGNSADELTIAFDGVEIDRVAWLTSGWPAIAGKSMQLGLAKLDATLNDLGESWCVGKATFGAGDKGTPGLVNDGCP